MIVRQIVFFGQHCTLACDARCDKAWGTTIRPRVQLSADVDDYALLADDEVETAPANPGTYEGDCGKPSTLEERLNKWCARECERSVIVNAGDGTVELPDLSRRVFNMHWRRG